MPPAPGRPAVREAIGVDALTDLAADPARAALFLDVDGTLAPIVESPDASRVPDATRLELQRLATRYALVACVSGRTGERAREIVGVEELTYVGEHGLELDPDAEPWGPRIHAFAATAGWPVESKPLSVAFHYRTAEDHDEARRVLEGVEVAARAEGFRTRWGRLVLEVLPPLDTSKGTAVRHLLMTHGIRRALYAGDDRTDLDGFAALDGLELGLRVAVVSSEGPSELRDRADVVVRSTGELAELLSRL
jgi:trehalose 6-phosphate phosphatase